MPDPIYRGIAFPFSKGPNSVPGAATDNDLIRQSLAQIVLVSHGERVMRPTAGSAAFSFVFENNDTILAAAIQTSIAQAVGAQEPRVILLDVGVQKDDNGNVIATLQYIVPSTQKKDQVMIGLGGGLRGQ